MAGKQAKILSEGQQKKVLAYINNFTRYPLRNQAMFLLSVKAGLRAVEISNLRWSHVTDAEGNLADEITFEDRASKGGNGGRSIPINKHLREALVKLYEQTPHGPHQPVIQMEREKSGVSRQVIVNQFARWFKGVGLDGCSSHSGRRTFITNAARKISMVGGSLKDVQSLAGHSSLQTTQRYIEVNSEARKRIVELV